MLKSLLTTLVLILNTHAASDVLDLEVIKVRDLYQPYQDFCNDNQGECDLSGPQVIQYSQELIQQLSELSVQVNKEIKFTLDQEQYNLEEKWIYPVSKQGDCEDNALEKRRRLVEKGFPRGALRMSTAFHSQKYYGHALLLVETTKGTYVLDQDYDEVLLWHQTPYIFEARENSEGKWERFDQAW